MRVTGRVVVWEKNKYRLTDERIEFDLTDIVWVNNAYFKLDYVSLETFPKKEARWFPHLFRVSKKHTGYIDGYDSVSVCPRSIEPVKE